MDLKVVEDKIIWKNLYHIYVTHVGIKGWVFRLFGVGYSIMSYMGRYLQKQSHIKWKDTTAGCFQQRRII